MIADLQNNRFVLLYVFRQLSFRKIHIDLFFIDL